MLVVNHTAIMRGARENNATEARNLIIITEDCCEARYTFVNVAR